MGSEDKTKDCAESTRPERALSDSGPGGSAHLVAGVVPNEAYERASLGMLDDESVETTRRLVVSGDVDDRLEATGPTTPEYARVVVYGAGRRDDEETQTESPPALDGPKIHRIEPSLGRLGETLTEVLSQFDAAAGGLGRAELRVAVDCLPALLTEYDRETVFRFLHIATTQVRSREGVAHVRLPRPVRERDVLTYAPLFDAVVELRVDDDELQERWHPIHSPGSGWPPVS